MIKCFSFGFHPYFKASKLENVDFDIKCATCSESAKGEQPAAPEKITLTRKEGADNSVRLLTGVQFPMTLTDSGSGHKVTVDADDSFDHAVLWQQDAESFVCMEPWNGWANSVNEEGKHEVLEPDEAMTALEDPTRPIATPAGYFMAPENEERIGDVYVFLPP